MRRLDVYAAATLDDDRAIVVLGGIVCKDGPYCRHMSALVNHLAGKSELPGLARVGLEKHVLAEPVRKHGARIGFQRAISQQAHGVVRVVVGVLDGRRNPRICGAAEVLLDLRVGVEGSGEAEAEEKEGGALVH